MKSDFTSEVQDLRYNGVSAGNLSKTALQYEWSIDKAGAIKELEQKAVAGSIEVSGHYDAKKNVTEIKKKTEGKNGTISETVSGLAIVRLITSGGRVKVDY